MLVFRLYVEGKKLTFSHWLLILGDWRAVGRGVIKYKTQQKSRSDESFQEWQSRGRVPPTSTDHLKVGIEILSTVFIGGSYRVLNSQRKVETCKLILQT